MGRGWPGPSGGLLGGFLRIPLLDGPERRRRLGEAARQRIATEFPLARMIDRYEAALNAVIK
jgi:glycosyltransferase involved in cell wall biosynthesis